MMESFAAYLFKSIIWLSGFALVYLLFLRNERFFILKRVYLISGILISFIFPLISIHYSVEMPYPVLNTSDITQTAVPVFPGIQEDIPDKYFYIKMIILILYLAGIFFLAVRLIKHVSILYKTINRASIDKKGAARLIRASEFPASFSFFNYVFINPSVNEAEVKEIMNHELVHVNQMHWLDLFLVEILRMVQWVNPFAWIYTGLIRLNHEYLADKVALQRTSNPAIYRATLINQLFSSPVISLSNSFNYSLNKKRFDMMKRIISSPYRKMKIFLILPVIAIVFYAFATPKYHYVPSPEGPVTIYQSPVMIQKSIKGVILNEEGKPLGGVHITSTGKMGEAILATSGVDGHFEIINVQADASLIFQLNGYKSLILKPSFSKEMNVKMVKDPEYREPVVKQENTTPPPRPEPLVVVDSVISEKTYIDVAKELGSDFGISRFLSSKDAIEKYGDKGKNGAVEITTKKRAAELGIKILFRRQNPDDFPTFMGKSRMSFTDWVISQIKYPEEASAKGIKGWVHVNYTIEPDGKVSNVNLTGNTDPVLGGVVAQAIISSPYWEPAKNPEGREPFTSEVTLKFTLPNRISADETPFIVVEEMPMYPGGEGELLKFLAENTRYPEAAKAKKIEGRVIVRFFVNTEGNAEDVSVLKGVDPFLDAEAVRVVGLLKGFSPGSQGGKPVNVWYMVPIKFSLPMEETPQ
jgi:TonB family protein